MTEDDPRITEVRKLLGAIDITPGDLPRHFAVLSERQAMVERWLAETTDPEQRTKLLLLHEALYNAALALKDAAGHVPLINAVERS